MSTEPAPSQVSRAIGRSAFWATASSVGSQIIRFSVFVTLSRLVSPSEFGTVAIASVLIDVFSLLAIAGISEALVMKKHMTEEDADTAFWTNLGVGFIFLLVGLAVSPLAAKAFNARRNGQCYC